MQWQKLSNAVACSNRKVINVSKELSVLAKEISKPSIAGITGFPLLLLLLSHLVVWDSVQPHGWQPTRLRHPWGFPLLL